MALNSLFAAEVTEIIQEIILPVTFSWDTSVTLNGLVSITGFGQSVDSIIGEFTASSGEADSSVISGW